MHSQKGYTAIEAVIWMIAAFALFSAVVGILTLFGWLKSDAPAPVTPTASPAVSTTTVPPLAFPGAHKIVPNQIVAIECDEFDCGAGLVAFEREYRDCTVIPIGPFDIDGSTVRYYFLVRSTQ